MSRNSCTCNMMLSTVPEFRDQNDCNHHRYLPPTQMCQSPHRLSCVTNAVLQLIRQQKNYRDLPPRPRIPLPSPRFATDFS
jgi:hypothetical protein